MALRPAGRARLRVRPRTLRGRLTLVFALVTFGLAVLVGILVDVEYRSSLKSALDAGLRTRFAAIAQEVTAVPAGSKTIKPAIPDAESFAQVIDAQNHVLAAAPPALNARSVLNGKELATALDHRATLVRDAGPRHEASRLLAGPSGTAAQPVVVVVGSTLEETNSAQHRLELALAIGLPALAALLTVAGWFLAGAALAPVQSMIEEADNISARAARRLSRRLAVRDEAGEELAQLARRLNALLERIEDALEHERVFLDDASHELRTPISIARGELELARLQAEAGSEIAAALDSALEEIDRLDHLAVNLLVLARMRSAGPPPDTVVELAPVARRAVDRALAADGRGRVTTVQGDAATVGDADALERAVRNVVENALRYARHEVVVDLSTSNGEALVEVRDDGPGFPEGLLAGAVGRFVAGDSPEAYGGAGLGLAIVDAIVGAHGGRLEIANRDDARGAVVRVRVPARPNGDGT